MNQKITQVLTMVDNGLQCPLFVLDFVFMKDIFEGKALRNQYFKAMMERKQKGLPFVAVTNFSSFKRAMYLTQGNISADNIRFVMELVKIHQSNANYKDPQAVTAEFTKFNQLMSEGAI